MHYIENLKKLPKANWILFAAIVINRLGNMALILLSVYLHLALGFSIAFTGTILALYGFGALMAGPISGWLCDRFDVWKVMIGCLLLNALIVVIYPLLHSIALLTIATISWAFVAEGFRPANLAAISAFCTPSNRKAAYALNRLGINLGMSLGPIVGSMLATHHFNWVFISSGISLSLAAFVVFFSFRDLLFTTKSQKPSATPPSIFSFIEVIQNNQLRFVLLIFIMISIIFFQTSSTLPLFIIKYLAMPISYFGLLYMFNCLMIVAFEIPLNFATAHWPFSKTMFIGGISLTIGFGMCVFVTSVWGLILSIMIWTIGEMLLYPAIVAYVSDIAPAHKRGAYMGMYTLCLNLSLIIGPFFGTRILGAHGPEALWLSCLLLGLPASALFLLLPKQK